MDKRERKFYTEEFKEMALMTYYNGNESVTKTALRLGMNRDTLSSWVFRKRTPPVSKKSDKLAASETDRTVEKEKLSPEAMEVRIQELERQFATEKMRGECLEKMIEIAERELKVSIRKKTGAKQSLR